MLRMCATCAKTFSVKPSVVAKGKGKFCSQGCAAAWRSVNQSGPKSPYWKRIAVNCEICGKSVFKAPNIIRRHKHQFCSWPCLWKFVHENNRRNSKRPTAICIVCDTAFKTHPSRIRVGKARFCSLRCAGTYRFVVLQQWRNMLSKRPTAPEQRVISICEQHHLSLRYVGDGSVVIWGLNPDFIENNGRKKIVEVFGDRFHGRVGRVDYKRSETGRKNIFGKIGYETLILWTSEMDRMTDEQIADRLRGFLDGN